MTITDALKILRDPTASKTKHESAMKHLHDELCQWKFSEENIDKLLDTNLVEVLIEAVGRPNHSQAFYHSAIGRLSTPMLDELNEERVNKKFRSKVIEKDGFQAVLGRLQDRSTNPYVTKTCLSFFYAVIVDSSEEIRVSLLPGLLDAIETIFRRNAERPHGGAAEAFALCCDIVQFALDGLDPNDPRVLLQRCIQFGMKGCGHFLLDPETHTIAKEFVEFLLCGAENGDEIMKHCTGQCICCAPIA